MVYVPPKRQASWSLVIDLKEFIEIHKSIDGAPSFDLWKYINQLMELHSSIYWAPQFHIWSPKIPVYRILDWLIEIILANNGMSTLKAGDPTK